MGAQPYYYFVAYTPDTSAALAELRAREFAAGRYYPAIDNMQFAAPDFMSYAPGPRHPTIDAAIEAAGATGTKSILDVGGLASSLRSGFASPVDPDVLTALYGTTEPIHEMLEELDFLEGVDRGECVYVVVYANDVPTEILFAGFSYD
jgi:hypothetical protein